MIGMKRLGLALAAALLGGTAALALEVPNGWYLHEDEYGGVTDLNLAWFEPGSGDIKLSINCQKGFSDVVVTVYVDGPGPGTVEAVLEEGETRFVFESEISDYNGFSVGTITTFGPELVALLEGGFSASVDGTVLDTYFSPKTGKGEIDQIIAACPAA